MIPQCIKHVCIALSKTQFSQMNKQESHQTAKNLNQTERKTYKL